MYKGKIVEQGPVLDIFSNPQHPYTKGLLACRPPLDVRLKRLPIVSDFMKVDGQGNIEEIEQSVTEATEKEIQTDTERKAVHDDMYAKEPVLKIKNLKTYFPLKKNFFGKVTEEVKAVDDVTFDVYPGETLALQSLVVVKPHWEELFYDWLTQRMGRRFSKESSVFHEHR